MVGVLVDCGIKYISTLIPQSDLDLLDYFFCTEICLERTKLQGKCTAGILNSLCLEWNFIKKKSFSQGLL